MREIESHTSDDCLPCPLNIHTNTHKHTDNIANTCKWINLLNLSALKQSWYDSLNRHHMPSCPLLNSLLFNETESIKINKNKLIGNWSKCIYFAWPFLLLFIRDAVLSFQSKLHVSHKWIYSNLDNVKPTNEPTNMYSFFFLGSKMNERNEKIRNFWFYANANLTRNM